MSVESRFDRVITSFYEAAADPEQWANSLSGLTDLLGAFATTFVLWDLRAQRPAFSAITDRYSETALQLYAERYGALDVSAQVASRQRPKELVNCASFITEDHVRRSEYYNDFLIPHGGRYIIGAKLIERDGVVGFIGIHRGLKEGPFDAENNHSLRVERIGCAR